LKIGKDVQERKKKREGKEEEEEEEEEEERESKGRQKRKANISPFLRKKNHALSPLPTEEREKD
jgi:hypothetical protein